MRYRHRFLDKNDNWIYLNILSSYFIITAVDPRGQGPVLVIVSNDQEYFIVTYLPSLLSLVRQWGAGEHNYSWHGVTWRGHQYSARHSVTRLTRNTHTTTQRERRWRRYNMTLLMNQNQKGKHFQERLLRVLKIDSSIRSYLKCCQKLLLSLCLLLS